jgi:hypothetical protein
MNKQLENPNTTEESEHLNADSFVAIIILIVGVAFPVLLFVAVDLIDWELILLILLLLSLIIGSLIIEGLLAFITKSEKLKDPGKLDLGYKPIEPTFHGGTGIQ